jgi:hypothetical protein
MATPIQPPETRCGPSFISGVSADLAEDACTGYPGTYCGPQPPMCTAATVGQEALGDEAPSPALIAQWKQAPENFFNPDSAEHRVTRTIHAGLIFSFAEAGPNPALCSWRIPTAMVESLKRNKGDNIGQTTLISVTIKSIWTTNTVATLATSWTGFPQTGTLLANGSYSPLLIYPGERKRNCDHKIFTAGREIYAPHIAQYAGLTRDSLWDDMTAKRKEDYTYVPCRHPVALIVEKNQKKLGLELRKEIEVDGQYKLHNVLVNRCVDALLTAVERLGLKDLSEFGFELSRADGEPMQSPRNIEAMAPTEAISTSLMTQRQKVELAIEIVYGFPGQPQ